MNIDNYYCINLYERNDRLSDVKKIFDKYDLPVIFYRVNKDPESGLRGCFNSHVGIIREAYKKNLENVAIFEDDIICELTKEQFDKKMSLVYDFINNNDYDIFFLGSIPDVMNERVKKITDNIFQVNAFCAHAYILSRSAIEKYKDMTYIDTPIDFVYMKSKKSYAIYPSLFYQSESKSDIAPAWFKFYGFKNGLSKLSEKYVMHINTPINLLIKAITILSIIIFFLTKKIFFLIIPIIYIIYCMIKY
jgi:hypothetical protein